MNEILKKRIDDFASEYAERMYKNSTDGERKAAEHDVIKGAEFILCRQWISIDEALPDCRINVIGRCRDGRIYVMRRCDYGPFYNWDVPTDIPPNYLALHSKDVTHWMPIPEMEV